jgi:hypothetical protein
MKTSLRNAQIALALAFTMTACSRSKAPDISDDLKQDLAKVGGGDVQLASAGAPKVDIVSASERTKSPAPAPKAPEVSKVASAPKAHKAAAPSPRAEEPAPAQSAAAETVAPVEAPRQVLPEPLPAPSGRSQSPQPQHTNREPRGGWKTPGDIIRNAPFPINP